VTNKKYHTGKHQSFLQ